MSSDQLAIEPMSPPASSTRYRLHVPFADIPSNVDRSTFPDGAGAGAGKMSPAIQFAGRYEPDVIWAASGSCVAASSSSVMSTPETSSPPPASDIGITFVAAVGETSRMSMSSGNVCVSPLIVRFRSVIVPLEPETTHVDGYGTPGPESGIVIAPPSQVPLGREGLAERAGVDARLAAAPPRAGRRVA